jgi:hypothetical protein
LWISFGRATKRKRYSNDNKNTVVIYFGCVALALENNMIPDITKTAEAPL